MLILNFSPQKTRELSHDKIRRALWPVTACRWVEEEKGIYIVAGKWPPYNFCQ